VFFLGIEPHTYICLTAQDCISKNDFQKSTSVQFKPSRSSKLDHRTKQYFIAQNTHINYISTPKCNQGSVHHFSSLVSYFPHLRILSNTQLKMRKWIHKF